MGLSPQGCGPQPGSSEHDQVGADQVLDRNGHVAVWAGAADADTAHEPAALVTHLLTYCPGAAGFTFVDGVRPSWSGDGDHDWW